MHSGHRYFFLSVGENYGKSRHSSGKVSLAKIHSGLGKSSHGHGESRPGPIKSRPGAGKKLGTSRRSFEKLG